MGLISFCKRLLKRDYTYRAGDSVQWFGNEYGGFFLDRSLLDSGANIFSFGVGEDISFDLAVSRQGVQQVFLFDPTPKAIEFIENARLPDNFQFYSIGISDKDEQANFFLPKNDNNVSGSLSLHKHLDTGKAIIVQLKKLSTIIAELNTSRIDVLKIDIEGSEYKVLKNLVSDQIFPRQICVEFHNSLFRNGKELFKNTLQILGENGYEVKGISSSGHEYLFVRKRV